MSLKINDFKKPLKIENRSNSSKFTLLRPTMGNQKKAYFYRELALLLRSSVDIRRAFEILISQDILKQHRMKLHIIQKEISNGKPLFVAFEQSGYFSKFETYSIRIGEETRRLESVLEELQLYFERKVQMRRQIISVLTYPTIVLTITLGVLYFMLTKIVPMFSGIFKQFNSELPKTTQFVLALSTSIKYYFGILLVLILTVYILHRRVKKEEWYRKITSKFLLKVPFIGSLLQKIYLCRFCQTMQLLTTSKSTLIASLEMTRNMIAYYPIESALVKVQHDITKGSTLVLALKKHSIFEHRLLSMLEVAEETNSLEGMFDNLSNQYNQEIDHQTKMVGVVIEPIIIVVIGVIVGFIMIAMYAPMFDLSKIIKN